MNLFQRQEEMWIGKNVLFISIPVKDRQGGTTSMPRD